MPDGSFHGKDADIWRRSVEEYVRLHPEDGKPDPDIELMKLRTGLAVMMLHMAVEDHRYGAQIIDLLDNGVNDGRDTLVLTEFLERIEPQLMTAILEAPHLGDEAAELANGWGDAALSERIRGHVSRDWDSTTDPAMFFALASVWARSEADPAGAVSRE